MIDSDIVVIGLLTYVPILLACSGTLVLLLVRTSKTRRH